MTKTTRAMLITTLASLVVFIPSSHKAPGPDSIVIHTKPVSAQQKLSEGVFPSASALQQIAPKPAPAPPATSGACGDNEYAHYIYMHESGCSTTITNAGGCLGLGQACPGSKLRAVCPNLDYACENAFFTDYANKVYGGWAGAYAKWLSAHWW